MCFSLFSFFIQFGDKTTSHWCVFESPEFSRLVSDRVFFNITCVCSFLVVGQHKVILDCFRISRVPNTCFMKNNWNVNAFLTSFSFSRQECGTFVAWRRAFDSPGFPTLVLWKKRSFEQVRLFFTSFSLGRLDRGTSVQFGRVCRSCCKTKSEILIICYILLLSFLHYGDEPSVTSYMFPLLCMVCYTYRDICKYQ